MKINIPYLTDFIRQQFPDFEYTYSQTAIKTVDERQYRFRLTGVSGGKKLKIFSRFTPSQLGKELDNGYKLVLKDEGKMIIIDLKKVSVNE